MRARATAACGRVTHLVAKRLERVLGLGGHLAAQVLRLALHQPCMQQPRQLAQLRPVRAIGRLQCSAGPAEGRATLLESERATSHANTP